MAVAMLEPVTYYDHTQDALMVAKRVRFRTKMSIDNPHSEAIERFAYEDAQIIETQTYPMVYMEECRLPLPLVVQPKLEQQVEQAQKLPPYIAFAMHWLLLGYTPVFEYYIASMKIIIEYDKEFLHVLALRHMLTGEYLSYEETKASADKFGVPVVKPFADDYQHCKSIVQLLNKVHLLTGYEGCVLRFENGRMFKLKTAWYFSTHKMKGRLKWNAITEKHAWGLVLNQQGMVI